MTANIRSTEQRESTSPHKQEVKRMNEIYEWTIEDFEKLSKIPGESIVSNTFSANEDNKDKWYIELYPGGRDEDCKDYFSIYLILKSSKRTEIPMHFEFSIYKHTTHKESLRKGAEKTFATGMSCGWRTFVKRSDVLSHYQEYLKNDQLKIHCQFNFGMSNKNKSTERIDDGIPLIRDLWLCFEQSKFSDVTLVVGDKLFYAHKMMLAARSSVFSDKLEEISDDYNSSMKNRNNLVNIDKMESEVVRKMLQYIYTGTVSDIESLAEGLLDAANRYKLSGLKVMCENALTDKLSIENAADILILSEQCNSKELKAHIIKFINNHLHAVVDSSGFKRIEERYPELLGQLIRAQVAEYKIGNKKIEDVKHYFF